MVYRTPPHAPGQEIAGFSDINAVAPPLLIFRTVNAHQGQSHSIGIGQRQYWLIEAPLDRAVLNSFFDQTMCPIAERRRRNPEGGLLREAQSRATRHGMLPWKEGQDRAGMANLVAVVEMICAGVVEIYCLLDETQSEDAGVEVEISGRFSGDRRHVMNARHGGSSYKDWMPVWVSNNMMPRRRYGSS